MRQVGRLYVGNANGLVFVALEGKGHGRQVLLELSHFMSLLAILPDSDLIATVPDDIAAAVTRHIAVSRLELPFKSPVIEVQQYWHRRLQHDPATAG